MPKMNIASRNMASMSHCCGFVHPLQHRLAEVPLPDAPFRLGAASLAIVLLTSGEFCQQGVPIRAAAKLRW